MPSLPPSLLVLVSLLTALVSGSLFRVAAGSLHPRRLNLVSWIYYYHFLLLSLTGLTLGAAGVHHYMFSRVSAESLQLAFLAVCYSMIAMPASMIFVEKIILRANIKRKLDSYFLASVQPIGGANDKLQLMFWIFMSLLAFLATAYTYVNLGEVPLLSLLRSDSDASFLELRRTATSGFTGNVYVRNFFALILAPVAAYTAYAFVLAKPSVLRILWLVGAGTTAVLAVSYSGAKGPLVNLILGFSFVYSYIRGGFRWRQLVSILIISGAVIALLYVVTAGEVHFALNSGPVGRLLFSQIAPLGLHFDVFPEQVLFLQGASFPAWFSELLGLPHVRSGRTVMQLYHQSTVSLEEAGVMNTLFIGEAWANFSWVGLLLSPLIVGVVVQTIYRTMLSLPKTPILVAVFAFVTIGMPITGGFIDFLWNVGWLFLFLIILVSLATQKVLVSAVRNSYRKAFQNG